MLYFIRFITTDGGAATVSTTASACQYIFIRDVV